MGMTFCGIRRVTPYIFHWRPEMKLKPEEYQQLVTCNKSDLEAVAEEIGIDGETAKTVRRNWKLRLRGRCVQCSGLMEGDTCMDCDKTVKPKRWAEFMEVVEHLAESDPRSFLVKRKCKNCEQSLNYQARYVWEKIQAYGNFHPASWCRECREEEQLVKAGAVAKSKPEPEVKKKKAKAKKKAKKKAKRTTVKPVDDTLVHLDPALAGDPAINDMAKAVEGLQSLAAAK
jgi:hypothetical protein